MNEDDRFAKPVVFPSGVRWEPTDYKSIDQTPYLEYLERNEEKTRAMQQFMQAEEAFVLHKQRWPWCDRHDPHVHRDTLTGTYIDEKPAGPMWNLSREKHGL